MRTLCGLIILLRLTSNAESPALKQEEKGNLKPTPPTPDKTQTVDLGGDVRLEMVWCPAASYTCGSSASESQSVIGAGLAFDDPNKARVVFAATDLGFAALPNGSLAVFRPDEAVLITSASGLPLPMVEYVATYGDDLILAGGGKIVAWRTTAPLPLPPAADLGLQIREDQQ